MPPKKLLLIESNQGDALLIKLALQLSDCPIEVTTIDNLEHGFDYLLNSGPFLNKKDLPEFIFLGLSLPDTEWLDFLKLIKKNPALSNIPVIILADTCASKNAQHCIDLGAERFIYKPLFLEDYLPQFDFLKSHSKAINPLQAMAC